MRAVLALTWRSPALVARGGGQGPGDRGLLTALAVLAFAVTTGIGLSVLGGLLGFSRRAADPANDVIAQLASTYVTLAWVAVVLLTVPLVALSGAAARLGVARRDERLATLRLLGVTPREVVGLTVLETARQGLAGAVLGLGLHVALLPVFTRIPFMGEPFTAGEMWVGWTGLLAAVVVVPLVAAVSGVASLRRVVISPLGVARRVTPPGLRWVRVLLLVGAVGAFVGFTQVMAGVAAAVGTAVLLVLLAVVFGTLNLVGPWTISVLGRLMAWRARTPSTLLAARRLTGDPKGSWRVVGGLGLASFVAGVVSVVPGIAKADMGPNPDATSVLLVDDLLTGGMLTLAIAFAVAAASAGITQAAGVLDRRREYALQQLAGAPIELFDAVRRREVLVPLVFVAGTSALVALVLLLPFFGMAKSTDPAGMLLLAGCLVGGVALMVAATETSRPLLRSVLRETVVRAD